MQWYALAQQGKGRVGVTVLWGDVHQCTAVSCTREHVGLDLVNEKLNHGRLSSLGRHVQSTAIMLHIDWLIDLLIDWVIVWLLK